MNSQAAQPTGTSLQPAVEAGATQPAGTEKVAQVLPAAPDVKIASPVTRPPDMAIFYLRQRMPKKELTVLLPVPSSYQCLKDLVKDARDVAVRAFSLDDYDERIMELLIDMASIDARCAVEPIALREQSWALIEAARPHWTGPLRLSCCAVLHQLDASAGNRIPVRYGPRAGGSVCSTRLARHICTMTDQQPAQASFSIFVRTLAGRAISFDVNPDDTGLRIKELFLAREGVPVDQQRLIYRGHILGDSDTLGAAGVGPESTLYLVLSLHKPVIYLFSPVPLRASVRVRMAPQWKFSCVYPVADVKRVGRRDTVEWEVDVRDDCLVDVASGNEEASNPQYMDSPPPSRPTSPTRPAFDPARPLLAASNSVVLDINQVSNYLQKVLQALGLHVEARTSFITFVASSHVHSKYWLPDMQRHKHVAPRFLPQQEYEQAAELEVSPASAAVTRVFMLFCGLGDDEGNAWRATSMDASIPACWRSIVGASGRAADKTVFRVLEWGGMEV
ncbi:hypothetical protein AURDEDRAFT_122845 [Auricularia subglabra TFB-10046 SS5]|nr:hypothetical protein AURDEDRAFT_122845 [Auricularia subglabra TFB-10046 SS5]